MIEITDECVGCPDYCINCGARHTERFYCDRCGDNDKLYHFGGEELCSYCIEKALENEKTESGTCAVCGEECDVYSAYGMCAECLTESLETVEGSE